MSTIELADADEARIEQFAGDLFAACLASLELANVQLGVRLGLYEALAGAGPVTAGDLASSAGIQPRYAANGSSNRRLRVSSTSTTSPRPPTSGGSRCRTRTPTC